MFRATPSSPTKTSFDYVVRDLLAERKESGESLVYEDEFVTDFKTRIKALEEQCDVPVHVRLVKELGGGEWIDKRKAYAFTIPKTNEKRTRRPSNASPKGKQGRQGGRMSTSSLAPISAAQTNDALSGHNAVANDTPAQVDVSKITDVDDLRAICVDLQDKLSKVQAEYADLQDTHYKTLHDACQEDLHLRNRLVAHKAAERRALRIGEQQLRAAWGAVQECEAFVEERVMEIQHLMRWQEGGAEVTAMAGLLRNELKERAKVNAANARRSLGRFGREAEASYADYLDEASYAEPGPSH